MFLTKAELDRRLKSSNNLANCFSVTKTIQPSSDLSKVKLPDFLSKKTTQPGIDPIKSHEPISIDKNFQDNLIASLAKQGEKVVDISRALGVPLPEVKLAAKVNNQVIKNTLDRVRELALDKTLQALGLMTEEKFENASLKDLSAVAANCSKIIEKTTPQVIDQRVQFIIHKPESRRLDSYKVIDV